MEAKNGRHNHPAITAKIIVDYGGVIVEIPMTVPLHISEIERAKRSHKSTACMYRKLRDETTSKLKQEIGYDTRRT